MNASGGSAAAWFEDDPEYDPEFGWYGENWIWAGEALKQSHIPQDEYPCFVGNKYICIAQGGVDAAGNTSSSSGAAGSTKPTAPAPTRRQVESWAYKIRVLLRIPNPTIKLGPDPAGNDWGSAFVGLPVWFWAEEAPQLTTGVDAFRYRWQIDAKRTSVTFDFGDGTSKVCTAMTPYPGSSAAGQESPTCGHTYSDPSLPAGSYTVTATSHWKIAWQGGGYNGTYDMDMTQTTQLPVAELHALQDR